MDKHLFGTNGVRGVAGIPPIEPRMIARLGVAIGRVIPTRCRSPRLLVGRDTRESGEWIEREIARGAYVAGASLISAGVIPTPAVAYLTKAMSFDAGLVITASHSTFEENGIQIFFGQKERSRECLEAEIEDVFFDTNWHVPQAEEAPIDRQDFIGSYLAHVSRALPNPQQLGFLRLAIDCANGATTTVAPRLFRALGFDLGILNCIPDGRNINLACGLYHPEALARMVTEEGYRLGIAFDGDGTRAMFVDDLGRIVDGDAVILMCAKHLHAKGCLKGNAVVASVMSNFGLELALDALGVKLIRCAVGERYVMEEVMKQDVSLGGEQSGNIIFPDYLPIGDGIVTALCVLRTMAETGRSLTDLASDFIAYPQVLMNVHVRKKTDLQELPDVARIVTSVESRLAGRGRLIVRYSGTEPLLRIFIEGQDQNEISAWAKEIAETVKQAREEQDEDSDPSERVTSEPVVALALVAGKLRVVSLTPDGTYNFLDPQENLHGILYVARPETLELTKAIEEFEALLNSRRAKEADFQRFFEDHPNFILTDEYKSARPHLVLQSESRSRGPLIPDFVLEPVEQTSLADLLEIKLPSARVFVLKQSRLRYSAAILEACAQLREYSAFFDDPRNRSAVQTKYGLMAYRPRLFVIIGRRPTGIDPLEARRVWDDLPRQITIRTYDDLLRRMRLRLDRLRGAQESYE